MLRRLLIAAALFVAPSAWAATGTAMPFVAAQWFDANGDPCNACKLYSYASGTSTPLATYTTAALNVANANPVVLDSAGRASVFLASGAYKFEMQSAAGAVLWTRDAIQAIPVTSGNVDVMGTAGTTVAANDCVYLADGSGGTTAGRWYLCDADATASSSAAKMVGFAVTSLAVAESGSIRIIGSMTGFAGLATGSSYYVSATAGAITSTPPTNSRFVGVADSTTTLVLAPNPDDPPSASATVAGLVDLTTQTLGQGAKSVQAGGSTGTAQLGGILNTQTATAANCGTSETDIFTYTLPASVLNANGRGVRVITWGTTSANANNKQLRLYFGGTVISDSAAAAYNAQNWKFTADVMRTGSNTQTSSTHLTLAQAGTGNIEWQQDTNLTKTDTGTLIIKLTGDCPSNATDVTAKGWRVELW